MEYYLFCVIKSKLFNCRYQVNRTLEHFKGRRIELTEKRYQEELQAFHTQRAKKSVNDEAAEVRNRLISIKTAP